MDKPIPNSNLEEAVAMLSANPDVIFRLKPDGTIVDLHAPPESLILPSTSFQKANITDVLSPEQGAECLSLIKKALKSSGVQLFIHDITHEGKKFFFEGRIIKNKEEVIMIVRDITSQKKAEILNDVLYQIAVKSSGSALTTEEFCSYIEEQLNRIITVSGFYIARVDEPKSVTFIYSSDPAEKNSIPYVRKNGNGFTEYIIEHEKPLFFDGTQIDFFKDKEVYGARSKCWIGTPIVCAGKPIGVLACQSYSNKTLYKESDLDLLTVVGNQIGLWIERKKHEQEKFAFNHIFEKSLNEIFIFDMETFLFKYVNEVARKNLDYSTEELARLTPIDIKHEFELESFTKIINPLKEDTKAHLRFETFHTRKNGTHYPVEIHVQSSDFNGEKVFIAMALDITERKQAERTIKKSQVQFKSLADNAPSNILKLDKDLRIKYINRGGLGYTVDDMLNKSPFDFITLVNLEEVKLQLKNVFKTGKPTFYEAARVDRKGRVFHSITHVGPIIDDSGEVQSLILIINDTTEEKRAKQKLESSYKELKLIDKINQASLDNNPIDNLVELVMDGLSEVIDLVGSRFYLYDEVNEKLSLKDERANSKFLKLIEEKIGIKPSSVVPVLKEGSTFTELIASQKMIVAQTHKEIVKIISDHTENSLFKSFSKWTRKLVNINTFILIPLVSNKTIFGILSLTSDKILDEEQMEKIKRFTNGITSSLAKSLAERDSQQQRQFTEDLLNNLPSDIAVLTPDHKYQFVNKAAIKDEEMRKWIIGKNDSEYCKKQGYDSSLADKRSAVFNEVSQKREGVEWIADRIQKDGEHQYILRKLFPIIKDDVLKYVVGIGMDITERKIAENQLIDSEERYRSLFEQMNEGLIFLSSDGIIQMVNPKMTEITGYDAHEIIGTNGLFLDGESVDLSTFKERRKRQKEGITDKYTSEIITKSGEKIWATISVSPQFDLNGNYIGSMSIVNDITDERKAEIASSVVYNIATKISSEEVSLQKLCEYIRTEIGRFIDTSNFYICLDKDSDTIEFPYHIDKDMSKGASFSRKKDNGVSEYILNNGKNLLFNGEELVTFQKKNKLTVYGEHAKSWIGAPIFIKNKVIGVIACQSYEKSTVFDSTHLDLLSYVGRQIGMFIDQIKSELSKEKFTENLASKVKERTSELEISQNESKHQLDTLNEVGLVSITDTKGNITYANKLFRETSGYSEAELLGQNHRMLKSNDQPKEIFIKLWDTVSSGNVWKGEIKNKAKNGNFYWVDTTIVPFYDVNGAIEKYVSVRFDITKQKELLDQLETTLEKEKELGELKSRFVSTASHQFRTPMTIIQSNSELLDLITKNSDDVLKPKLANATARIKVEVKRMTNLMDEILILGKISAGKMVAKKAPTNILNICEDLCEKYDSIQTDNRSVDFKVFGKEKMANLDRELMDHAISNLLSNAFKYSTEENPKLELNYEKDQIIIKIKDKGIGIPKNEIELLFLPFHRAINVGEIPGTGLGLTIVKDYIELNNGSISIKSKSGEETLFTIQIPYN